MPRFEPFVGLRYDEAIDLNQVTAPPYDVLDDGQRQALADSTAYNVVHVDVPDEAEGPDRYQAAARRLAAWQAEGVLVLDDEPAYYVYRMGYKDEAGRSRQTAGVIGALELAVPGEGDVLPHEHTTPKARSDRLDLLRATETNLSPIWGLSLGEGLTALCELPGAPVGRCTDELGVHHRLWKVTATGVVDAIRSLVSAHPVVIADGHHRYETSLAYSGEVGGEIAGDGGAGLTMALVVELTESQLGVQAIHRLLGGLDGVDLPDALGQWFEVFDTGAADASLLARMDDAGALALVVPGGQARLLRPRAGAFPGDVADVSELADLDSSRLDVARAGLGDHQVAYQHGVDTVLRRLREEPWDAAILLRPATVPQIAAVARERQRMPPKTTYFHPKVRTGLVFRPLA